MSLTSDFVSKVASTVAITNLIGTNPMRLYPQVYPQNPVYPLVTWYIVTGTDVYSHSGYSQLVNFRLQLSIWATTWAVTDNICKAFKDTFRGLKENNFDRVFCEDMGSDYNEVTKIYKRYLDLLIGYREV